MVRSAGQLGPGPGRSSASLPLNKTAELSFLSRHLDIFPLFAVALYQALLKGSSLPLSFLLFPFFVVFLYTLPLL